MSMKKIRVLFADDHSIVRSGLRALFRSTAGFTVVGEASDGEAAVELATLLQPDVAILDISMPKLNGIEATEIIKRRHPAMKVLILTIHEDEAYVYKIIRAGASGYIVKNAEKKEIIAAVRAVAVGEAFFSPGISKLMIEKFIQRARQEDDPRSIPDESLTKREREILQCIAEGLTSKEISEKFFLSVNTVNTHRANLMQKLNLHDTASLVRYAIQSGLVKVEAHV
jgi:DNA-binding NarL/FixJ family response regulator